MSATQAPSEAQRRTAGGPEPAPLRPQRPWAIVAEREIMVRLRDKGFVLSTLLTLVLIVVWLVVSGFLATKGTEYRVAALSGEPMAVVELARSSSPPSGPDSARFTTVPAADEGQARAAVERGDADAALVPRPEGFALITDRQPNAALSDILGQAARGFALERNAAAAGTSVETLSTGSQVRAETIGETGTDPMVAALAPLVFGFLFYLSSIVFGMSIANSVVEEKQNRVVEIIVTAIPIASLMYGKVLGNTVLALGQMALFGGAGLIAASALGQLGGAAPIIAASGWFLAFFLVGFLIIAAAWAAIGAMASRSEDLQTTSTPVTMLLLAAFFGAIFAKGAVLTVLSYVPIVSSMAMPVRVLQGEAEPWEPGVALVLAAAFAVVLVRAGSWIYRRAVLQTGGAITWGRVLRLEG